MGICSVWFIADNKCPLAIENPRLFRRRNTPLKSIAPVKIQELYGLDLPALLTFAHLLLPARDIALLPAALMFLFFLGFSASVAGASPLLAAHLAL